MLQRYNKKFDATVNWQLKVLSFFHDLFVLEFANSSNQRNFLFTVYSSGNRPMSCQISRIRVTATNLLNASKLFFSMLFSFSTRVCF